MGPCVRRDDVDRLVYHPMPARCSSRALPAFT
ncbi:MAG: hypothetical protein JWR80_51, partial [Bradyrhizobium sp.]|nr:hypothetical protein [Bradyrhizobium sp.]